MGYTHFNNETGIFLIDYSGEIGYAEGVSRMDELEKVFEPFCSSDVPIKVLFDVSNTVWESRQIHDALSKIARQKFSRFTNLYMAVLNSEFEFLTFENERWFTKMDEALSWLKEQK